MNCQDVTRIIDTSGSCALAAAERSQVEGHVHTCPSCAAVWPVHSALMLSVVPPMPPELAVRCRTAWAFAPGTSTRQAAGRRLTLIGSAVALAAAAGVLALWMSGQPAPETTASLIAPAALTPPPEESRPPIAEIADTAIPVSDPADPALHEETAPEPVALPLLPRPPADTEAAFRVKSSLDKALEIYPQLVEGPAIDGNFLVAITMRLDGTVLNSVLRQATSETLAEVSAEIGKNIPRDGDGRSVVSRRKTTPLPDGRMLRGDLTLWTANVSNTYDMARSDARVLEIVGARHRDLMLPATSEQLNRVVVFLSDDGTIQREVVERVDKGSLNNFFSTDAGVIANVADMFATQVEVEPSRIGLTGNTVLQSGSGTEARILHVRYAWQRRSDESRPSLGQQTPAVLTPQVDRAKALIVVKHVLPDAFVPRDPSVGSPTLVLTARGEVIQAGWVRMETGRPIAQIMKEQLVPGVETSFFSNVSLTDESGMRANVFLAWEVPKEEPAR
jgi:hypothetical protein